MGKGTRRHRKQRRRLRQTLNHGHEVRHKLVSGRTGKVHSTKLKSLKGQTKKISDEAGVLKVLVPGQPTPVFRPIILSSAPRPPLSGKIIHPVKKRPEVVPAEVVPEEVGVTIWAQTEVDAVTEAYGLALRALMLLVNLDPEPKSPAGKLLNALANGIEGYEKKPKL